MRTCQVVPEIGPPGDDMTREGMIPARLPSHPDFWAAQPNPSLRPVTLSHLQDWVWLPWKSGRIESLQGKETTPPLSPEALEMGEGRGGPGALCLLCPLRLISPSSVPGGSILPKDI